MISLAPLVADAVSDIFCPPHHPNYPKVGQDPIAHFQGLNSVLPLPLLTTLPLIIALVKQARMPFQTQSPTGVKLQAAVFMLSAILWVLRVSFPLDLYLDEGYPIILIINAWYHMVGFVAVDDSVFALGQGVLLLLSLRQFRRAEDGERQPLLGSSG
ncbi:hypothetical protein N7540_010866 [Penicillium herquei]|nr:hypothetical protein N7540_010866 [Penicillium herquei]